MSILFECSKWERIRNDYRNFWNKKIERPVVNIVLTGYEPGREKPKIPIYNHFLMYDFSVAANEIIDAIDYELSRRRFFGDAYPLCVLSTPVLATAFLGADPVIDGETVWMKASGLRSLHNTRFCFEPENKYWQRTLELYHEAVKKWGDKVVISMATLGGNFDILVPFFTNEALLLAVNDAPEELERLLWEVHKCWWRYFDEINNVIKHTNKGYSCWATYFSDDPTYILQCDFSAMLGPDSFKKLVMPELIETAGKLKNVFFHLDGPDMVRHLDMVLEIPEIIGVQWIPGPKLKHGDKLSVEIHKRVISAGKLANIVVSDITDLKHIDMVVEAIGDAKGFYINTGFSWNAALDRKYEDEFFKFLEKYKVPI